MTRRVADRYLLGEQLGAGGTSRVHAALDERLGRRVAIKLLDARLVASADPAGRERFLREGPTSASFSHRNAVTVFDAGEDDADLYIVMELVDGPSLAEHMAEKGPLPIGEATRIARQVLAALAAAHSVGIVHRDVKPANVLLGSDGEVKLADFGIAKRFDDLDESVTTTGMVIGTPRYLAPEQAIGATVTPSTDVYAMGILLFEMITGRTPFAGDSSVAVAMVQQSRPAPDLRSRRPEVSTKLAATVARALVRDPAGRYPTALEMAADLDSTWSPPDGPLPAAVVATQVMQATEPAAVGVRSGDTQLAPAHDQPSVGMAPHRIPLTTIAIAVVTLLIVWAVVATLLSGDDNAGLAIDGTGVTASASPADTPAVTTAASPAPTSASVDEIIPGFARTDDLQAFLEQLEHDPALVGDSGGALADQLRELLDERSARKRRDKAEALRKQLTKWVDAGELNPAIAEALDKLLGLVETGS